MDSDSISIVVTMYSDEREQDAADLLASIVGQDRGDDIEVIFVVEGSELLSSKLRRLADSFSPLPIKVVPNAGTPGLSGARNTALPLVSGAIVAFVDDDAVLATDWTRRVREAIGSDPAVIGVTGVALPLWENPEMAWLPEEFYWLVSCTGWLGAQQRKLVRNAWGVNMAFRKWIFDRVTFDERFGGNMGSADGSKLGLLGEDTLFSVRACNATRGVITYSPEVKVFHKVYGYRLTRRYVRRRAYWEGFTKAVLASQRGLQFGLGPERNLLKQILLGFFPRTFRELIVRPGLTGRKLSFAVNTLGFVGLGYASAKFRSLGRITLSRFGR